MADILNQIDAVLADVSLCGFCQSPLRDQGPSQDFCGEVCQWHWYARQVRVKSGIEKRAVEPEAVVERDDPLCTCPPDMPENSYQPGCPACEAFQARINPPICRGCRTFARVEGLLCVVCMDATSCGNGRTNGQNGRPMLCIRPAGHGGPHEEGHPDGSQWYATGPVWFDETHTFNAEEFAAGGVVTTGPAWSGEHQQPFFMPAIDAEAERLEEEIRFRLNGLTPLIADWPEPRVPVGDDEVVGFGIDVAGDGTVSVATVNSEGHLRVGQLLPPVDAASEPDPDEPVDVHRYECPHSDCDWTKVALDRDVLLDLAEAHELQTHAPRSWWRRRLPGGTR